MWHYKLLLSLRNEPVPVLDFANAVGLVTFPSFHTTLAIVTAYGVRDVSYLRFPAAALNAVVIVATLPQGGHYLIDLIAGAGVAIVAILILRFREDTFFYVCGIEIMRTRLPMTCVIPRTKQPMLRVSSSASYSDECRPGNLLVQVLHSRGR